MTEPHPLPPTMVSPRDRRPNVWLGGVLQIGITRACDKSCFGCTQGSNLGGKPAMMTPAQFETAVKSLAGYFGVVGVFGGNPCLNPHFEEICEILRAHVPFRRRGLWCNKLFGKGRIARATFNPAVSNLNVHMDREAYEEFRRDWPEAMPFGLEEDSRHSPPFVAMQDVISDEAERWRLIGSCDVNQNWSAMIGLVRGELRGFFCEIAYAQAALHENDPDWPDTGVPVVPGWWDQPISAFDAQVRWHCHRCGIPLRGYGDLAVGGSKEQTSAIHLPIYRPKQKGRAVEVVTSRQQLGKPLEKATHYLQNAKE